MSPFDASAAVSGPAYGRFARFFTTTLMVALAALSIRVLWRTEGWISSDAFWLLGLTAIAVASSWWQMLTSTTTIDARGIRQSGWIEKAMSWDEVVAARVITPRLAPRLMVKARLGRPRAFHAGSAELATAFARIATHYRKP
ncbi:MAG: hypothetical protein RR101_04300 [Burkholderiaceae bacterium]